MQTMRVGEPLPPVEASYLYPFIQAAPPGDVLKVFESHAHASFAFMAGVSEVKADFAYAAGKWTVRQLFGRMLDAHLVFSYRAIMGHEGHHLRMLRERYRIN
jgi:hypothetical protein